MSTINGAACPFVAQKRDPETHYAFASKANYCHQVKPFEPINLSYQGSVCLAEKYSSCPVYLGTWQGSLPPEIRGEVVNKKKSSRRIWLWLPLAIVVMALLGFFINPKLGTGLFTALSATQEEVSYTLPTTSKTPTIISTPSPQATVKAPTQENAQSANDPTATQSPSSTFLVPTVGPFLKTPFGPYERYLIHKVVAGESVGKIASMYNTTSEVIIAVNRLVEDYYFYGETTPTPAPVLTGPYYSPTPTTSDLIVPTKTLRPTGTKPAIPSATVRATITLTPTPYETPDVWTTVLIHPGDILVILPGMKDPESAGQYQAIYFDRVQKTADLAHLYSLTVDELRYYNGLGPGELIAADRWIVVPFGGDGPPPTPAPTLLVTIDLSSAITPKFGPEGEYVLHMVRRGENLPQIAARYHTTEEVLHQANEFTSLQPGNVLVVLPGRSDPTGIKSFGTLLVEDDIPVGVLASQMKVFESDLVWFNGLEDDQIVVTGQWLIYPNPEPTATRTFEPAWTATAGPAPTGTKQVGPTSTPTATLAPPTRTPHP